MIQPKGQRKGSQFIFDPPPTPFSTTIQFQSTERDLYFFNLNYKLRRYEVDCEQSNSM